MAAASAARWFQASRSTGTICAKPQGADTRSHLITKYRHAIVAAIEVQVDITLVELADLLRRERGACFAPSTVWHFLDRHDVTTKNRAR